MKYPPGRGAAAATLALVAVPAWLRFAWMNASAPAAMAGMAMPAAAHERFGTSLAMWEVMVIAMMTPMLVLPVFARLDAAPRSAAPFALASALGYLAVWSLFAVLVAVAQQMLAGSGRWIPLVLLAAGMGNIAAAAGVALAMFVESFLPRARYVTGVACMLLAAGIAARPALF